MQPIFKQYNQGQAKLFPQRLDDYIGENDPVRLVNQVADELDLNSVIQSYKGGGTSSFCPRMMIKILFYAYMRNIYSCRKIEAALSENVHFLWLSGKQFPDFRTINDFRSKRLKHQIHSISLLLRICHPGVTGREFAIQVSRIILRGLTVLNL